MRKLEPVEQLQCPLCGRGLKVAKPRDPEHYGFEYQCKCGFVMPVIRMDESGDYARLNEVSRKRKSGDVGSRSPFELSAVNGVADGYSHHSETPEGGR